MASNRLSTTSTTSTTSTPNSNFSFPPSFLERARTISGASTSSVPSPRSYSLSFPNVTSTDYLSYLIEGDEESKLLGSNPKNFLYLRPRLCARIREECMMIIELAWPVSCSKFLWYLLQCVVVALVGHLPETVHATTADLLAGAALGSMFCTVTGYSVGIGLCSALDTLCGQAFGARNYYMVGFVLQRTIIVVSLCLFPISVLWQYAEEILVACHQQPEIAYFAGLYAKYSLPGLWAAVIYNALLNYLQSQGIVKPELYVGVVVNVLNFALGYFLMFYCKFGFIGAPITCSISNWASLLILLILIIFRGYHERTWAGWDYQECIKGWGTILRFGVPGMLLVCAEWWLFEVLSLVAGYFGAVQLASTALILQYSGLQFMIPMGLSIAVNQRVNALLGAGQPYAARFVARCTLGLALIVIFFNVSITLTCRNYIGMIFTNDAEVIQLVSTFLPIVAVFSFFDGLQGVAGGIIRGMGRQLYGATINLIGYWCICLPAALCFSFLLKLEGLGLWYGVALGLGFVASSILIVLVRTNWEREAIQAAQRVNLYGSFDIYVDNAPKLPLDPEVFLTTLQTNPTRKDSLSSSSSPPSPPASTSYENEKNIFNFRDPTPLRDKRVIKSNATPSKKR